MKRLFLLSVAAVLFWMPCGTAQAVGERTFRANNGNGPVSRMIEMERRKNAWLRQRFGR